jgi:hypothetical protein
MIKRGYIIHRIGELDFLKTPELTQLPHLLEHLLSRNINRNIWNKTFPKANSRTTLLFLNTEIKDLKFKDFKNLSKDLYFLDKRSFNIEKSRLIEEILLKQNDFYSFIGSELLEKLIGLPSWKTYINKHLKYFENLKFPYFKKIFLKNFDKNNRFLYYVNDQQYKTLQVPQNFQLPKPSFIKKSKKIQIKKDKNFPPAFCLNILLDFNIEDLIFLQILGDLILDHHDRESFYWYLNQERGLLYHGRKVLDFLSDKILASFIFPSTKIKEIKILFNKFMSSINIKNKNLKKNFYFQKKRVKNLFKFPQWNFINFFLEVNSLYYLIYKEMFFFKDFSKILNKITFEDFVKFVRRIEKNNELFIVEIS